MAGLGVCQASHGLYGETFFIKCLEENGDTGGQVEVGRAVRFDGDGAEDEFAGVFFGDAEMRRVHVRLDLGRDTDDTEAFYGTSLYPFESFVHILK